MTRIKNKMDVKQLIKSYWFWFYVIICTISVIDIVDHLTRTESYFLDIKLDWILFTFASTLTVCLSIYVTHTLTKKLFKTDNLIFQSISIVIGGLIHIYISGPIYDRLILEEMILNFLPNPIPFFIGLSLFYMIRFLLYIVTKKTLKPIGQDVSVRP